MLNFLYHYLHAHHTPANCADRQCQLSIIIIPAATRGRQTFLPIVGFKVAFALQSRNCWHWLRQTRNPAPSFFWCCSQGAAPMAHPEDELERLTKKMLFDMDNPPSEEYFGKPSWVRLATATYHLATIEAYICPPSFHAYIQRSGT